MWRLPKAETPWSKERQPLGFWLADQKVETPKLRFLKSVSLADQKCRDTLMKRQIHPNLGFCSQCVTCWSNGGDNSPSWKLELRFLKSLSLADQKMETTHQWKLELRFLKSVSLADQKWRHPDQKAADTQRWRHPDQKAETPKLRFLQSVCHLLIKWWRQLPLLKVGT